jgi:hypothetical protein
MRMAGRIGSRETGPKLSDASYTGPARWLCVDRVRQESGFGKAADRPPYDQKRTLEATNGTSQIDVKRTTDRASASSVASIVSRHGR